MTPTTWNPRHLGLPPRPAAVVAPAARATRRHTNECSAHVTKLLSALLNLESSAAFLSRSRELSPLLRADVAAIHKAGRHANARMLREFHAEDAAAVDTLNSFGNALDAIGLLLAGCAPEVAEDALNAAAEVVRAAYLPGTV